jgi:hypothetical protein
MASILMDLPSDMLTSVLLYAQKECVTFLSPTNRE